MKRITSRPLMNSIGILTLALMMSFSGYSALHACDVAVISGAVTSTGRPAIWKNRDCSENWHQKMGYFPAAGNGGRYIMAYTNNGLMASFQDGSTITPAGGLNEYGFAIACTTIDDVFSLVNVNTMLMWESLKNCRTLSDFETQLADFHSNYSEYALGGAFAVIDASGGAALYECYSFDRDSIGICIAENDILNHPENLLFCLSPVKYRKYDANTGDVTDVDTETFPKGITITPVRSDIPNPGFYNMTNGYSDDISANLSVTFGFGLGLDRKLRGTKILGNLKDNDVLDHKNIMWQLARDTINAKIEFDPGFVEAEDIVPTSYRTDFSISRAQTRMALVVDGVANGEDKKLATFWCNLGEPSIGIFTPFFPSAGGVSNLVSKDMLEVDGTKTKYYEYFGTCFMNTAMNRREIYKSAIYSSNEGFYLNCDLETLEDNTINLNELASVQSWTFNSENNTDISGYGNGDSIEEIIIRRTEEYLEDMREYPSRITSDNLKNFSDYCAEFGYTNFNAGFSTYYPWSFNKPWGGAWEK